MGFVLSGILHLPGAKLTTDGEACEHGKAGKSQIFWCTLGLLRNRCGQALQSVQIISRRAREEGCGCRVPCSSSAQEPPWSVAAVILGDGSGTKLYPLTKRRAGGAIPLAAHYRLIDVVVSNCINSNITKIYALTQFNSTSLNAHLSRAYSTVGLGKDGFVEVLAAYQNLDDEGWFQGDADSIRRCLWVLEEYPVEDFLVLPGHHLYRMEYEKLIKAHRDSNADITVVLSLSENQRRPYSSSLKLNSKDQTLDSRRKLEGAQAPLMTTGGGSFTTDGAQDLRSMGIYVIKREALGKLLLQNLPHATDFKSEVIPGAVSMGMKVHTYTFNGYWEDMRDVEAFYQANLGITRKAPTSQGFNFYDREHPIYTLARCLPPTRITGAAIKDSVIGDGCVLNRCKINGSVIGMRACIGDGAIVEDTIVMGADIYQIDEDFRWCMTKKPCAAVPLGIGEQTQVRRAIIDKNARIGKNVKIVNADNVQEGDREESGYIITGGIVVVLKGAVIPDGSII
ncbi:hypothetical protein Taro_027996 [Colocasia esculenta]|uniref:Nucleotidyl transferase domain-containing protein n=1 Tax=Colocasia esculenta TaxID=4460 RepID=A0A843VHC3_COLES|nr:hypothetical protein [Colocasia esculenta]